MDQMESESGLQKAKEWIVRNSTVLKTGVGVSSLIGLAGYASYYAFSRFRKPGLKTEIAEDSQAATKEATEKTTEKITDQDFQKTS